MERTTIMMDEYGRVAVPSDAANLWMNEMELVTLFGVIWKSHATLTLLAKQDCPLWLQYD